MTAAGACLAVFVSQCRLVDDNVLAPTGLPGSASNQSGNCISTCARAYADSMKVEAALHVSNVRACNGNAACSAVESTRHVTAVHRISNGRKECMDACHHQGGGTGGR
jgi:hypothetical protein